MSHGGRVHPQTRDVAALTSVVSLPGLAGQWRSRARRTTGTLLNGLKSPSPAMPSCTFPQRLRHRVLGQGGPDPHDLAPARQRAIVGLGLARPAETAPTLMAVHDGGQGRLPEMAFLAAPARLRRAVGAQRPEPRDPTRAPCLAIVRGRPRRVPGTDPTAMPGAHGGIGRPKAMSRRAQPASLLGGALDLGTEPGQTDGLRGRCEERRRLAAVTRAVRAAGAAPQDGVGIPPERRCGERTFMSIIWHNGAFRLFFGL